MNNIVKKAKRLPATSLDRLIWKLSELKEEKLIEREQIAIENIKRGDIHVFTTDYENLPEHVIKNEFEISISVRAFDTKDFSDIKIIDIAPKEEQDGWFYHVKHPRLEDMKSYIKSDILDNKDSIEWETLDDRHSVGIYRFKLFAYHFNIAFERVPRHSFNAISNDGKLVFRCMLKGNKIFSDKDFIVDKKNWLNPAENIIILPF